MAMVSKLGESAAATRRPTSPASRFQPQRATEHVLKLAALFQCPKSVRLGFELFLLEGKYYISASQLASYNGLASLTDAFKVFPNLTRILVTEAEGKRLLSAQGYQDCDGFALVLIPSEVEGLLTGGNTQQKSPG